MAEGFTIATFKHVADGLQEGQFAVGERRQGTRLDDLDPIYRELLDRPITVTMAVIGPDGRARSHPDVVRPRRGEDTRQHRLPSAEVRLGSGKIRSSRSSS